MTRKNHIKLLEMTIFFVRPRVHNKYIVNEKARSFFFWGSVVPAIIRSQGNIGRDFVSDQPETTIIQSLSFYTSLLGDVVMIHLIIRCSMNGPQMPSLSNSLQAMESFVMVTCQMYNHISLIIMCSSTYVLIYIKQQISQNDDTDG